MMRPRLPVVSLIVLAVLVLLPFINVFITYTYFARGADQANTLKTINVINYVALGETLVKAELPIDLRARLREALDSNYINFFVVKYHGEIIDWENTDHNFEKIDYEYKSDRKLIFLKDRVFSSVTRGDYQIVVGAYTKQPSFYTFVVGTSGRLAYDFIRDALLTTVLVALIVSFYFREIRDSLNVLRDKNKRDFSKVRSSSIEAELLKKGFASYQTSLDGLNKENKVLKNQVLPALRSEIMSGRKPPYDFICTLVRMDINNFSQIFSKYPLDEFMKVIDEFFEEATHIVSRYNGFIYEFVGDEVIFYFKDEDHENSSIIALSAIRDINLIAKNISEKTKKENGYSFVVKSSLAHGKLRFGKQVDGYSLAGAILIETVRILSHIHEKDDNVVFYDTNIKDRVSSLCMSKPEMVVHLKGITEEKSLHSYISHTSLENILSDLEGGKVNFLTYYRNDLDLSRILKYLNRNIHSLSREMYLAITKVLKNLQVTKTSEDIKKDYLHLLDSVTEQIRLHKEDKYLFYLSSLLIMGTRLIGKDSFDKAFSENLKTYIQYDDRRVVANILDVFSHFDAGNEDAVFQNLLKHQDNRILANALVKEGKRHLNKTVMSRIEGMLGAEENLKIASGLYALGELVLHYREHNIVYLETNTRFMKSVEKIESFFFHEDIMVRRQSFIAARKSGLEELSKRIDEIYKGATATLKAELDQHYYGTVTVKAA